MKRHKTIESIAIELLQSLTLTAGTDKSVLTRQAVAKKALGRLSPERKDILTLHFGQRWSHERIAKQLGFDVKNVERLCNSTFQHFMWNLRRHGWVRQSKSGWSLFPEGVGIGTNVTSIQNSALPPWPTNVLEAYQVFMVSPSASEREKRLAYLRLVKCHHPDAVWKAGADVRHRAEEWMKRLNRAWELICARSPA